MKQFLMFFADWIFRPALILFVLWELIPIKYIRINRRAHRSF